MTKVSVIIPVYNAEKHLPQCLESAVTQTLKDIEVVCVNDGSTDSSPNILREYSRRDGRIRIVEQENQGAGSARTCGLSMASGEYVLFLDSDDFFEPTAAEDAYLRCVEDDAEIAIFRYRFVNAETALSTEVEWSLRMDLVPDSVPFSHKDVSGSIFAMTTPCIWNKMFKRSFIVDAGLRFPQELKRDEDLPFTYLGLMSARRITVIDKSLINYRTGQAGSSNATIHHAPDDICKALVLAKRAAVDAGVFEENEHNFVGAALDQCLITLRTIKTVDAFNELYDQLKNQYFAELGIDGRAEADFVGRQHAQYVTITSKPAEAYLFEEDRFLRSELAARLNEVRRIRTLRDETAKQLEVVSARLDRTKDRLKATTSALKKIKESRSYRVARLLASVTRTVTGAVSRHREAE